MQIDSYNWTIIELKIKDGHIENWVRDVESTKEIKAEKLVDIIAGGRSLDHVL